MYSDFYRSAEFDSLVGDSTFAANKLGWSQAYSFHDLVEEMSLYDLEESKNIN